MKIRQRFTWRNSIKHITVQPLRYFEAEKLQDLVDIINEAESNGLRVRAVGSGHSFSDVAVTRDYLVNTHRLNRFLEVEAKFLKDQYSYLNLVEVECGITIREFNRQLDKRNLAIINMGGIDHQTVGGAVSTATHGSGIGLPALPGMIRAFTLVTTRGEVQRIEPSEGITDPLKYRHPHGRLIQDDEVFYSALVGMGGFGIVYSYVMETREMYWIREDCKLTTWAEVKKAIMNGSIHVDDDGRPLRSVSVRVNPYLVKGKQDRTAILIRSRELSAKPKRRGIAGATRPMFFNAVASIPGMPKLALWWMQMNPRKIPGMTETSLKGLKDRVYINRAHKVLFLGQVRMKEYGMDSEFAFDAHDPQKLVDVLEALFAKAAQVSALSNLYHSSQIGMRWVKASGHYLSPDYGTDVCYVDTPNHARTKGAYEITEHYQDLMFAMGGKPHWGKLHNRIIAGYLPQIPVWYPKFETWKKMFRKYNPMGTFRNNFTDRLGV